MASEGLVANRWYLEIDGIANSNFKEFSGGDIEIEVVEHRETANKGNVVIRKVPGNTKYGNIVLRRGVTDDKKLWDWMKKCVDSGAIANRKNGTITMYDNNSSAIRKISFTNGWICKYKIPAVDASKNEVSIEEIEICVEKVEITQ